MKTKKYFGVVLIISLVTVMSCNSGGSSETDNKKAMVGATVIFSDTGITRLVNSQVCMINNRFMNSDQIAVPIDNKTYYGCCEGCVKALKDDSTTHYTADPLSGEQIDKAIAFIIGKPGSKQDVLYFKTETNAREYFAKTFQQSKGLK